MVLGNLLSKSFSLTKMGRTLYTAQYYRARKSALCSYAVGYAILFYGDCRTSLTLILLEQFSLRQLCFLSSVLETVRSSWCVYRCQRMCFLDHCNTRSPPNLVGYGHTRWTRKPQKMLGFIINYETFIMVNINSNYIWAKLVKTSVSTIFVL